MYLLQNLQAHLSIFQSFIFSLKITIDFAFLISWETISHILATREDMLSVPKNTDFFAFVELNNFSRNFSSFHSFASTFDELNL